MDSPPHVVEDCFGLLKLYNNGSIWRSPDLPSTIPLLEDNSIIYKDLLFNEKHELYLRLYKPKSTSPSKLPILYYFHGGGFCFGTRTFPNFHNICVRLSGALQAHVIAPDHRLAPEHRLPAAIDDAYCALKWLQGQALHEKDNMDTWLGDVDFDRVFMLGDSSGGNLAHHLAVRLRAGSVELAPVRVRGYVLLGPFFGGCVRTRCEEERSSEEFWTLDMYDRFWRLSVPVGGTLDHPFVNPFGSYSPSLAEVALDPILVVVGSNEILRDRVEDYARKLKELGKKIEYVEIEGKQHGFVTEHPFSEAAEKVMQIINRFKSENSD